MTDIVERLRAIIDPDYCRITAREAAAEIERLRGLCQELADVQRQNEETYGKAADEIERLREREAELQAQCGYTDSIKTLEIERLRDKLAEYENVPVRLRHIMATGKLPPDDMK